MSVLRWSWLLAATLVVSAGLSLHGERADARQDDTPPDWTRWNFPDAAEGVEAATGESSCSTVEAARANARSNARSVLLWALATESGKWTEKNSARDDKIDKALDRLIEDTDDYIVKERDGVFHGYALVQVRTDRANAAIARVPASVRRPAASWLGQAVYTPSVQNTLEIRGPRSVRGSFAFHLTAEPSGGDLYWYFDRIDIEAAGGPDARWAFDISINGVLLYSTSRAGFDSVRPSTCWLGTSGQVIGADGNWRETYLGFSMGSTPKAASYAVRVQGFRLD